ncbi:MAG: bacteriohemerythrin [Turneriella sp.]|nr:bacteriohemerythrin [Turneriella sp.]
MTAVYLELNGTTIAIAEETLQRMRKFWREHDLTIGIELLDAQHIWLIALVFHLEDLQKMPEVNPQEIKAVLLEALRYAQTHFMAEELVMSEFHYPESESHTHQHHTFQQNISNLANAPTNIDPESLKRITTFLRNWLLQHIKREDMAYRDFFRRNSIDANSFFNQLIAAGSEFQLTQQQLNLHKEVTQHNEIVPGISNSVLAEIERMWRSFSIRLNVPLLDMQHLWLVKMVVELSEALRENYEKRLALLDEILPEVKRYIEEHFTAEEAIMDAIGYPARTEHKNMHAVFVRTITSHGPEYITRTRQGASVLVNDLREWLLSHIVIEDSKLAKFCREKSRDVVELTKKMIQEKKVSFRKAQILLYQYMTDMAKYSS